MAAGAWTMPPGDDWRPEFTTAANDSSRIKDDLRARLAVEGLDFQIDPNPHTWDNALQAWPSVISQGATDEINISTLFWLALGIHIHPCRWIEEQYNNPESMLHALLETPGRLYFADGGFWTRGALPPAHFVPMGTNPWWLWAPYPLQFMDAMKDEIQYPYVKRKAYPLVEYFCWYCFCLCLP